MKNFVLTIVRTYEFEAKNMEHAVDIAHDLDETNFSTESQELVCEEDGEECYL